MNAKSFLFLGGVTAVVAVLAILVTSNRESSVSGTERGVLLADLTERGNDVARIEVQSPTDAYAFVLDGETWGLEEKAGYPVDFERVRRTVVQLSELDILDRKTDSPDLHAKLGLLAPDAVAPEGEDDALATRLTLKDAGGQEIASVLVGKTRPSRGGLSSFYARKAGEDQCWLVEGRMNLENEGKAWLDKQILKIEKDRVSSIEIHHADGEVLKVAKPSPAVTTLEVQDVPEGRKLRYPTVANGMTAGVEWCDLEDVLPADEFEWPEQADSVATFRTFDGVTVIAEVLERDEKTYARFRASYSADDRYQPVEGEELDTTLRTPEEAAADAREIQESVEGWVYVIPRFNTDTFKKRMEALLEELPVEEEGEGEGPGDGGEAGESGVVLPPPDESGEGEGAGEPPQEAPNEEGPSEEAPGEEGPGEEAPSEEEGGGGR